MKDRESFDFDAFISFNKADVDFVERLVKRLDKEVVAGRNLRVYYSERNLGPGQNIVLSLEDAMEKSNFAILVITPNYLQSEWTKMERSFFVHRDPAGVQGKLIPLLVKDCPLPSSIRFIRWIDFTQANGFARGYRILINRLQSELDDKPETARSGTNARASTLSHLPDIQHERVISDLFPVISIPNVAFAVPSSVKTRDEIWPILEGRELPPFAFDEDNRRIIAFANPLDSDLKEICASETALKIPADSLLLDEFTRITTDLLNRCLTRHVKSLGLYYDNFLKKNFYAASYEEKIRYYKAKNDNRKHPGRFLFRYQEDELEPYFAHRMSRTTFTKIGNSYFLKITPGWHFTSDGAQAVSRERMNSLSSKWMNRERNRAVLLDLRMWSRILSNDSATMAIDSTNGMIEVSSTPLIADTDIGIMGDYVGKAWSDALDYEEETDVLEEET